MKKKMHADVYGIATMVIVHECVRKRNEKEEIIVEEKSNNDNFAK